MREILTAERLRLRYFALADFAKKMEVRAQNCMGGEIVTGRKGMATDDVINRKTHRNLSLDVRPLMNRREDGSLFEVRNHFREQVRCD